jgi:hypothetical protein
MLSRDPESTGGTSVTIHEATRRDTNVGPLRVASCDLVDSLPTLWRGDLDMWKFKRG